MMRFNRIAIAVSCLLASPFALSDDRCGFMDELKTLLSKSPEASLGDQSPSLPVSFLSVADGYSPSSPGFPEKGELRCAKKNYKFEMIWAGADAIACEGQEEMAAKANDFARDYNFLVKQQLIELGKYECTDAHLQKEKLRLCKKTGQSSCRGDEDWNGAFRELNEVVSSYKSERQARVGYRPERIGEYWLSVYSIEQREAAERVACDVFPKYGVDMDVTIYVRLKLFDELKKEWDIQNLRSIVCTY